SGPGLVWVPTPCLGTGPEPRGEDMTGTEPPRPEDATSWPEFRARSAAVRASRGPGSSPTQARSQAALGLMSGVGAGVFLIGAILTSGPGRWTLAVETAISAWMFV